MDVQKNSTMLGGLTPDEFMRRYWHKKPLLVRQAIPGFKAPIQRAELFELAAQEGVESRLIQQKKSGWTLGHGPFANNHLPAIKTREWTLLVQGVDLHHAAARALLDEFRFVPEARLDDLMISWASDGGGVGPHFDSYDVFLLQAHGRRRWRIGRQRDPSLVEGMPVKILANFEPEEEYLLEPGDMLYLPPRWAHDGVAEGECMTYSIGFRSPQRDELAREALLRIADALGESEDSPIYRDPKQVAVQAPGLVPEQLQEFARDGVMRALAQSGIVERALGETLTEPKGNVWFDPPAEEVDLQQTGIELDRRTRMMYDAAHVYINGESYRASGKDATLMRRLADQRGLTVRQLAGASEAAISLLESWFDDGWLREASVI
ncbi:JmjC domain-containing protein [Diaphorobacter aerolatus]|uniref:Cupin domain-containing protein n=1 Tax=Diaphorobacter aerolatus TaxID=1288495 RepID=A0A7H0GII1_9BURK|nr:cupin domain-containing protein [Diaphorobacter aerolatus]QNP48097.1 cupin domain-containing protein [Diaphorobacter aerolatus]